MENLLLVFDEIDDLFSMFGLVWRPIVSFVAAVALFVATGFVFFTFPVTATILAFSLVSVGLLEMVRQRMQHQANPTEPRQAIKEAG
jgi:hypothetical protein